MHILDDLLRSPSPYFATYASNMNVGWLKQDSFQGLTAFQWEGRPVSSAELFNLVTHLIFQGRNQFHLVPQEWREDLYHDLASQLQNNPTPYLDQAVHLLAEHMAGPKSLHLVKDALRDCSYHGLFTLSMARALWRLEGLAALPTITEAISNRALVGGHKNLVLGLLDEQREKLGVAKTAWELLLISESALAPDKLKKTRRDQARKLRELRDRNIRFCAADLRLLIDHPAHAENLRGLVLAVYSADGELRRTFVLPDPLDLGPGESIAIAHPAALPVSEIARWKASFTSEGLTAPFDQWGGASHSTGLNVAGLTVEPCALFMTLEAKGWQRHRPDSGGVVRQHSKLFPDLNLRAVIEYTGVPTIYGSKWAPQTIASCRFFSEASGPSGLSLALAEENVNPIATSAIMADLASLREKNI